MSITFSAASRLVFIGDSITDVGRLSDPDGLGSGYVRIVRDYLLARDPAAAPAVINKGLSGNKVPDLEARWQRDVIEQRPDVLSIKIGINDVWHGLGEKAAKKGTTIDRYTSGLRGLLQQTRQKLPNCALVLCEPSIISPPQPAEANELLQPYVRAIRELGHEFKAAAIVPLHAAFRNAETVRPAVQWTTDGVHPTAIGHMLLARTWLVATGLL